jgi:hypothetical protein
MTAAETANRNSVAWACISERTSIQVAKAFKLDDVSELLDHAYRLP